MAKRIEVKLGKLKSEKQRRFLLEWLIDKNGTAAAIRAGYSEKGASVAAAKLMKNPILKSYIEQIERADVKRLSLSRDAVLQQLMYALTRRIADFADKFGNPLPPEDLPEHCQSIVDGYEVKILQTKTEGETTTQLISVKYKLTPHATAREQAMKHKGLLDTELLGDNRLQIDIAAILALPAPADTVDGKVQAEEMKALTYEATKQGAKR